MAFVEDFTVFFTDFGISATPSGGGSAITVIFDRAQVEALGGNISATSPVALAASADVSSLTPHSSTLTIAGSDHKPARGSAVTYQVLDIQPDGTGISELVLQEVA